MTNLYTIKNESVQDLAKYQYLFDSLFPFLYKKLQWDQPLEIIFRSDSNNAQEDLMKTGFYDNKSNQAVIFIDKRAIKDALKSVCHEAVHHTQNCRGDFKGRESAKDALYAIKDKYLWGMEMEAYSKGAEIFRKWEDNFKAGNLKESRNDKLFKALKENYTRKTK